jgi:Predicted oxidoreductases (related to aryl-alcohol dehydrogenases)
VAVRPGDRRRQPRNRPGDGPGPAVDVRAAGGRFIDTADVYAEGERRWIGEWLDERDRSEFVIASKVYWPTRENDPNANG